MKEEMHLHETETLSDKDTALELHIIITQIYLGRFEAHFSSYNNYNINGTLMQHFAIGQLTTTSEDYSSSSRYLREPWLLHCQ